MDDPNGPTRVMPAAKATAPLQPPSAPDDYRLQEVRRAVGSDYDVLGEIGEVGEGAKSGIAYLAQRRESMRLDVLRFVLAADYVEVIGKIGLAMPVGSDLCPKCGSQLRAGVRFCGNCRTSLTAARLNDATQSLNIAEWLEVKSEAGRHNYELLGQISAKQNRPPTDEQGGAVVFVARTTNTSRIVALRFERGPTGSPAVLGLDQAGVLPDLIASLFDEPAKPAIAPAPAPVVAQPEPAPPPTPAMPVAPLPTLPPSPMPRPGRPIWAIVLGGAVAVAALAWLVSIISARNARNAERAAVASARADSVERARADSISRAAAAAAADSATVQINAGLPVGATVTIDKAPVSGRTVRLSSGSHTFSAIGPGFRIATQTLNVRRGQTLVWPSRLEPEAKRDTVAAQHTVANCADAARRSDWTRALSVCSKEAGSSKGNAFAERTLGTMHERGLGVAQNLPVAGEWYSASASHGDRVAQYLYGRMLQDGRGVKRDEEAAFRLFQTSADQGEVDAQFAAGDALDHGRGVRTNKAEAARWYLKAAEQGHAEAQFALGMLYEKGDGVSKSDADANKWFQKAAAKGNERAKQELARRGVRP